MAEPRPHATKGGPWTRIAQYTSASCGQGKARFGIAEGGRGAEVRYLGEIGNTPAAVERLMRKLERTYETLHVCCEAGLTGYGLYCQIRSLVRSHSCSCRRNQASGSRPTGATLSHWRVGSKPAN